ncbi:hypothetical protein GCM10029978_102560 [Actinoallomurus acanthiterrae]
MRPVLDVASLALWGGGVIVLDAESDGAEDAGVTDHARTLPRFPLRDEKDDFFADTTGPLLTIGRR